MPIKKRSGHITKDTLVYVDVDGHLQIKTPAVCTKWDQDFRMRIVRHYVPPRTLRSTHEHEVACANVNNNETTYRISGKLLRVTHPVEYIKDKNYLVVLRTDVQNLSSGKQLFLCHDNPAMRILMVYSFIADKKIGGVPDLQIADIS